MTRRKKTEPVDRETAVALLKRMWHEWLSHDWRRMLVVFALMAVVAATTGAYPILIERAYTLFEERNFDAILLFPIAVVIVTVAKGLAFYFQQVLSNQIVNDALLEMRKSLFRKLVDADTALLAKHPTGTLITRFISDLNLISNAFGKVLSNSIRDILTVIGLVIAMFYLDWELALVVLVVYPIAAIPIIEIGKRLRRVAKSTQVHMGDTTAFLNESLGANRLIKTYGLQAYEDKRSRSAFERLNHLIMRRVKARARLDPILEVLGGLAVAGVIVFGGWRIANGEGTIGGFTGFVSALLIAAQPVRGIGQLNAAIQEGISAAQRFYNLYDIAPKIKDRPDAQPLTLSEGEIAFKNVSFAYDDDADRDEGESVSPAVRDVSFTIEPGQKVALVGASGAGKSTIMALVPRLFDVSEGAITIDGTDIRDATLESLRASMALVSQDVVIFDDTIRQNIAFGSLDADDAAIEAAAKAASAHAFISGFPEGYDTVAGDRGQRLSGGERQRISIARAILKDAPILLLDEATSALDAQSERDIQDALAALSKGRTTLVIAHRLATVRDADMIIVLDGGRIVETGTHDALITSDGTYAHLARLQFTGDGPSETASLAS
ncbi:MAG: ABC transporter ATP-binding protein [Pseudomonadota bacterium]